MYAILVNQLGLNPHFVLDEMQMYEVAPLIDKAHLKAIEQWKQTKLISYIIAQTNSTKKIDFDTFLKFSWEEEKEEISLEEIEKLREESKHIKL